MRRSIGMVVLMIIVGAIVGSGLAYALSGIFPSGPVHKLLFQVFQIGVPQFTTNLGFITFTFGINLAITGLTVLFIILAVIILYRL
jgi:hypothetical protein